MFIGPKPAAQPRSLRSIVESKNNVQGFPQDLPIDAAAGVPFSASGGIYVDLGLAATAGQVEDKVRGTLPFTNARKGR